MDNAERWKPKYNEIYYFVDSDMCVSREYWNDGSYMAESHYGNYNCFETEAEAKAAAEKVKELLKSLPECSAQPEQFGISEQLPKLTEEVFNHPDSPEWAMYAAVDKDGEGWYYEKKPVIGLSHSFVEIAAKARKIDEKFDATDWQNSLIERPQKFTLPEWCKVGGWCYGLDIYGKGKYFKITNIQNDYVYGDECCVKSLFVSQARLRPYNSDEMRSLVGKVIEHDNLFLLVTYYDGRDNDITLNGYVADAKRLLNEGFTINGNPCGVLEHLEDGKWVE